MTIPLYPTWEPVHTIEHVSGCFKTVLSVREEDEPLEPDDYDNFDDLLYRLRKGTLVRFAAKVECYLESPLGYTPDLLLATEYLGNCLYNSVQDFIDTNGYYGDIVRSACALARRHLHEYYTHLLNNDTKEYLHHD